MAYTPINWQTGDTIDAAGLNKMDNGWGVDSSVLCEETITTEIDPEFPDDPALGSFTYSTRITADSITVTFDGTDYVCPRIDFGEESGYGGWDGYDFDFTDYPFAIGSFTDGNYLNTENGGTHTVKISVPSIEVSDNFSNAVNKIVDTSLIPLLCVSGVTTYNEMVNASKYPKMLYFRAESTTFFITKVAINAISFLPASQFVTASFVDNIFTVTIT